MATLTNLGVLNTVTTLGADAFVDSNGFLQVAGFPAIKASEITGVEILPAVSEVLQVTDIVVSTATANAVYSLNLMVQNTTNSTYLPLTITVTSASSTSATAIATQFRDAINSYTGISVTAALSGADCRITAKTGFAVFRATTTDAKLTVSAVTSGVAGRGLGSLLLQEYVSLNEFYNAGGFADVSKIEAASSYTEVDIYSPKGNITLLVKQGVTNFNDLLGSYGTLTGLNAGYRVVLSAPATTTAAVTVTTGAIALSGGSTTFATLGAQSGDFIAIGSDITCITGITGLTAGFGTLTTAVSAATFKFAAWRNLPL